MIKKVLCISDVAFGGAATACRRLVKALKARKEVDVTWFSATGTVDGDVHSANSWPSLVPMVYSRLILKIMGNRVDSESLNRWLNCTNMLAVVRKMRPEIINIHNIHQVFNFNFVERLPRCTPIVWTLHDMWVLTGHCTYSFDCSRWKDGCSGKCPQIAGKGTEKARAAEEWKKRDVFFKRNAHRIVLVCPSRWLTDCARTRFGGTVKTEQIPYSVDITMFRPLADKASIRRALDLPVEHPIILFVSWYMEERKGIPIMVRTLELLYGKGKVRPVIVGLGHPSKGLDSTANWILPGLVIDEKLLNLYYNAADLVVLPSRADTFPNVLLEAISAGTPCVTFDVGGCGEIVRNGITGYVVCAGDVEGFAECIERVLLLSTEDYKRMRVECRKQAETEYTPELQAKQYVKVFSQLIENNETNRLS